MLKQLQKEIGEWRSKNFPNTEKWEPLVGIMEELGELSHAHLKQFQNIRNNEDHEAKKRMQLEIFSFFL
jgi:hypothetical protein